MKFIRQYYGLRKEMYIIFWGRVVTNMGALIWPMLTLILKSKLGFSAKEASVILLVVGIVQVPCTLIGGKLADRFNKRNLIVACDLITVAGYIICAFLPFNKIFVVIFCISGIFAQIEWPSYDALVADFSSLEDREKAYSLNYLGGNLGLVLAPTLGGILFKEHLPLAFIISGISTLSSTILILFFIKDTTPVKDSSAASSYEKALEGQHTFKILSSAPILILFVLCMGIIRAIYQVGFGFLMPLSMENIFSEDGALFYGTLTSVNAVVVIFGTPLCTSLMDKLRDINKLLLGEIMQIFGFIFFMSASGIIPLYYFAMVIFTFGEILITLGDQPYLTKRVPTSHRGRISSLNLVTGMIFQGICLYLSGVLADIIDIKITWLLLISIGFINVFLINIMRKKDKRFFKLLY